jgi:hypothetical protein
MESNPLYGSRILRREAGEGWHPDGLNLEVLNSIVAREMMIDDLPADSVEQAEADRLETMQMFAFVELLKAEAELSDPPPHPEFFQNYDK